jgi:hypothetical protein
MTTRSGQRQPWTCPACGREFRRTGQSHTCDPVTSLEDRLALLTPLQREICEAILALLPQVGDVKVEPVRVGLFLKHGRTFASLRLRRAGMRLLIMLPRRLDHPRLAYSKSNSTSNIAHGITLRAASDVDADVQRWLAESYASSPP